MIYANGDTYDGQWKNGKEDGQGTMKFHNGDEYEGEFSKGKLHGKGTYTFAAGHILKCIGEWKESKKCGWFDVFERSHNSNYNLRCRQHQICFENDELIADPNVKREREASNEDTDTEDFPSSKRRNVCVSPP